MGNIPVFDLTRQYSVIGKEIEEEVRKVLSSGNYILGSVVEKFEAEFAKYCGSKFAIGVASGTDALVIGLRAAGIKPGDEVIIPSFTFFATGEAVANVGAAPVFADVDLDTMCIAADEFEKRITSRTRAAIPVHLFGHPAPMTEIMEIARKRNIVVIEDACQAVGTKLGTSKAGALGHIGAFSFFPTKNLGAAGDGGAMTTNDENIDAVSRKLRSHGSAKKYMNEMLGYNSRLDAVQAAALSVKLRYLDKLNQNRWMNAKLYRELLGDANQIILPTEASDVYHTYHQYTIRLLNGKRDALKEHLAKQGIGAMIYYPIPVHKLGPFAGSISDDELPNTMTLSQQVLSLPIFPELTRNEIETVASVIKEFFIK